MNEEVGLNTNIYPLSFPNGGKITFTGSSTTNIDIAFKFNKDVFPNLDPSYLTDNITINGNNEYTVNIPSQGSNTFNNLTLYLRTRDVPVTLTNITVTEYES